MVRLEGFEPPTLGSVGTFHGQQLLDLLENLADWFDEMCTDVQWRATP